MARFGKRMMMTLVGGFSLLFVLACGTASNVAAQRPGTEAFRMLTGVPVVGDSFLAGAYCVGVSVKFITAFTAVIEKEGNVGYWQFMRQANVPCYDVRIHEIDPVRSTLVEMMWKFKLPSGQHFEMWKVKDETGKFAYTWMPIDGQET